MSNVLTQSRQNWRFLCFHLEPRPKRSSKCRCTNELRCGERTCKSSSAKCRTEGLANLFDRASQWKVRTMGNIRYGSMLVCTFSKRSPDAMLKIHRSLPLSVRSVPQVRLHRLRPQSHQPICHPSNLPIRGRLEHDFRDHAKRRRQRGFVPLNVPTEHDHIRRCLGWRDPDVARADQAHASREY
jgi:hypothetical protein